MSIILTIAFKGTHFWLTYLMASLCRRPSLLSSLQAILQTVYITAHTQQHESKLELKRMKEIAPKDKLLHGPHIWNLAIIDNIDFMAKSFQWGNLYDSSHKNSHATLRMVFQFRLPLPLYAIISKNALMLLNNQRKLFGYNLFSTETLDLFSFIFKKFLQCDYINGNLIFLNNFDDSNIHQKILSYISKGCCNILPPNIVILEAGNKPNDDEGIYESCEMYFEDIDFRPVLTYNSNNGKLEVQEYLDISADESIFRRLINYKTIVNPHTKVLLGAWHLSKDMCGVLVNIFSGYGIFNIAAALGAKYLTNFQKCVDYRATSRTLDLIWTIVGIALHLYMTINSINNINDIFDLENEVVKVWAYYWQWAGLWKGHKIGIRNGNFDMQIENLKAFSPLFYVAGKLNYANSVMHALHEIDSDPYLETILHYVASVNITRANHFLPSMKL